LFLPNFYKNDRLLTSNSQLGRRLKRIVGILEIGLFFGRNGLQVASAGEESGGQKPVAAYFGMENGEVEIRACKEIEAKNAGA